MVSNVSQGRALKENVETACLLEGFLTVAEYIIVLMVQFSKSPPVIF